MKFCRVLLISLLILFLIHPVVALEDSYEFSVSSGTNVLDFGKMYNGSFVSDISGVLYEYTNMSGSYYQQITLTSSQAIDNATVELIIPYNSHMKSDYSDLRFYDNDLNELPYFLSNYTTSNANVKIKTNMSLGENICFMSFGNPDAVSKSNEASVYLYFNNTQTNYGNTTIFTGDFNSLHAEFRPSTGSGGSTIFYLNPSTYPYFGHWDTSAGGYFRYYTSSTNYSENLSARTNGANLTVDLIRNVNGSSTISVVNDSNLGGSYTSNQVINFSRIQTGVRGTLTIYKLIAYNSTSPAYSFGGITEIEPESVTNISIGVPESEFNSVSSNLPKPGVLDLKINYTPHVSLLTNDGISFDDVATLLFQPNPTTLNASYQISIDQNFYGVIASGTSNSTITASLPPGSYYWRVQQPNGSWTEPRTFTINPKPIIPGSLNFTIRNELTNATVSATVLISNETTTLQKTGSTITFNSSEVTAGNYTVRVNQTNYSTRNYEVTSPGNYTLYILPTNLTTNNASVVYFSLIDNTNQFQYNSTKLEIIKQTANGSILIQNSYFDASGLVVATLNQFDNYILKVVSDDGHERYLGKYVQAGQTSIQLVISEIILMEPDYSVYGGFTYNLTKSPEEIKFDWLNPNQSLMEPFTYQIYKNGTLELNVTSDAPFGSINFVDGGNGFDPNATYEIIFEAKTTGGNIRVHEYYKTGGEAVGIDFESIPLALRIITVLGILVLTASQFNITNGKFAAVVVALIAGFFALIGFIPFSAAALGWILFISIVALKTER